MLNLKPGISELRTEGKGVYMLADASSGGNIKPGMVIDAFYRENGQKLPEFALEITRTDMYMDTGTDKERHFIPLRDGGEDF